MSRKDRDKRQSRMADRTGEVARDRDKEFGSNTLQLPDGIEFIELEKRKNLNIIPYVVSISNHPDKEKGYPDKGDLWWRKPILVHKNIGVNNDTYVCPRTIGKKCPICEEVSLLNQEYTKNEKIIGQIRAKKRDIICVQDADDPKKGVQLFDVSYHLFTKLLLKELDNSKDEYRRFMEPEDGYSVNCRFAQEKWQNKEFWKIDRIDFESREDYSKRLLEQAASLDEILIVPDYDELRQAFMQMDDDNLDNGKEEEGESLIVPDHLPEKQESENPPDEQEPEGEKTGDDLVGASVTHEDGTVCEITDYNEKKDVYEIKDENGDLYDATFAEFTVNDEEEASLDPKPSSRGGAKKGKGTCPFNHEWGTDCGKQKECVKECEEDVWDQCNAEHEKFAGK